MGRVGAVHQPLPEQRQVFRPAPSGPQGPQPPQHPGKGLHPGRPLPVVGGVGAQLQPGVPGGEAALYRLQQLQQSALHILPGAQGILMDGQLETRHSPHPFSPLVAMPWTNCFWKMRNTMTTGIRDTTEAAIIRPYSVEYWPMNIRIPNCTVFSSVLFR